jgi:hypothetical protein
MYSEIIRNDNGEEIGCRVDRAKKYDVFELESGYIWELPANSWTRRDHGVGMPARFGKGAPKVAPEKEERQQYQPLGGKLLEPR